MTVEALVMRYGVLAIFLGSGIEGEAVVVTGGILAHKQLVPLWAAMAASACGSCLVDQLWFFLGRYYRHASWVRSVRSRPAFERAVTFLERHPTAFVFGFRFVYGMRTVSPIAIGTTQIGTRRFMALNALAAAVWGPLFTYIGYAFGKAIDPMLHHLQRGALGAGVAVAVVGTVIALAVRLYRTSRHGDA